MAEVRTTQAVVLVRLQTGVITATHLGALSRISLLQINATHLGALSRISLLQINATQAGLLVRIDALPSFGFNYRNIVVTPATLYRAPVGEAPPDESTIAYGAAWGGNWVNLGYTLEPVAFNYETEIFKLKSDLSQAAALRRTLETITITTVLAELTGANLALVLDGSTTPTAAGPGQVAYDLIQAGGSMSLSEYAWGFEGFRLGANNARLPVRVFLYRGVALLNDAIHMARSGNPASRGLRVTALANAALPAGRQLIQIHIIQSEISL